MVSAFSALREIARNDLIVTATVNGRPLRLVASSVFEGQPPRVVWSDLMRVLGVKLLRRLRMTKVLRAKFAAQLETVKISGRDELAIPLPWAAAAMAAEPGMPDGLEIELAAAAELAVSRAGEVVLGVLPVEGRA